MDEKEIVNGILSSDPDIKIVCEENNVTYFELFEVEYGIQYYLKEERSLFPQIIIQNYDEYNYPHIMTYEFDINGNTCRSICLYENESVINYIYSYEDKICETIERLKNLLLLSDIEKEEEFQKEFLHYWNKEAKSSIDVFIKKEREFQRLNIYKNSTSEMRFVSNGIKLNNSDKYTHVPNVEAYYIPITDNRRILPPVKNKPWTLIEIMAILKGELYCRISKDTYESIASEKSKSKIAFLMFEMIVNNQNFNFGVMATFKTHSEGLLLMRLGDAVTEISPVCINRCDYYFLSSQIGNDTLVNEKRIAVIGAGSLGSYVAEELVKDGIKNITLFDDDTVTASNILRHKAMLDWRGFSKVELLKFKLERIHPEIFVDIKMKLTEKSLKNEMDKFDLIIFTVGNSDIQLSSNQIFKDNGYDKPVVFAWLEAGGTNSHILIVDYSKKGCFECLYTNENGELRNNKANNLHDDIVESKTIRTGCGATRVAYGTSILLKDNKCVVG